MNLQVVNQCNTWKLTCFTYAINLDNVQCQKAAPILHPRCQAGTACFVDGLLNVGCPIDARSRLQIMKRNVSELRNNAPIHANKLAKLTHSWATYFHILPLGSILRGAEITVGIGRYT